MRNHVYIAMSLDGYIADANDNLEWLTGFPNEDKIDFGYNAFITQIDALLMGRNTFEFVLQFDTWPYDRHVFVLSTSLESPPEGLEDRVTIVSGDLDKVMTTIEEAGYSSLYVDGGRTIQSLLREDMVQEMIITVVPILLGGGSSLFGDLDTPVNLKLLRSSTFNNGFVQHHYRVIS